MKSKGVVNLPFNAERDNIVGLNTISNDAQLKMKEYQAQSDDQCRAVTLGVPSEKRQELKQVKDALSTFQEMKSQKIFIMKRNRIIKNGWRDGILGVEMPGDSGSHFYSPDILK